MRRATQWNDRYGADSSPSRVDFCRRAFRPIATSTLVPTPVLPEAPPEAALSAQLRRPPPQSGMSAQRRLRSVEVGTMCPETVSDGEREITPGAPLSARRLRRAGGGAKNKAQPSRGRRAGRVLMAASFGFGIGFPAPFSSAYPA